MNVFGVGGTIGIPESVVECVMVVGCGGGCGVKSGACFAFNCGVCLLVAGRAGESEEARGDTEVVVCVLPRSFFSFVSSFMDGQKPVDSQTQQGKRE